MRSFEYEAVAAGGARVRGRLGARDELDLDRELDRRGLVLVGARALEHDAVTGLGRLTAGELAALSAQLSTIVAAGVPLVEGLDGLAPRQERAGARELLEAIADELRGGTTFSDALARRPAAFPPEFRAAVRAGEASGALAEVLEGLASHLETRAALRERAVQALIYPALLLGALCALVLVLVCFLLPRVTVLYTQGTAALPAETRALLAVSDFIRDHALLLGASLAVAVLTARALGKHERWRRGVQERLLSIPRLGRLLRAIAAARFASTAAVLHGAGCDAITLLSVSGEASGNAAFRAAITRAQARVERGALFSEALAQEPLVDRLLVQVVAVGERSGELAPALARVARRYEEDVPRELKRYLSVAEPLLLAFGGLVVAWILLAALLPIFELYEHIA